ncbi:MAG: elongation factor G [Rhodobacteraceae bacterium]|nr:elongation factor G [Paracoccaceae bacterium]
MRTVAVLGPAGAGKSALVAQLAHLEGHGSAREEADHLTLTTFPFMGENWAALELAGGPDWAGMAGPILMAADAAVLVVPPDPGAAVLAAPYLRALEAAGTPTLVFINKMDAAEGRVRDIVAALQAYTGHVLALRQVPIREGGRVVGAVDLISERAWRYREGQSSTLVELPADLVEREHEARGELLEHMADFDETLLEELIEDRVPASEALYAIAAREFARGEVIPVLLGAASHRNGIMRLMKALRHEAPPPAALAARLASADPAPAAVVFHAQNRRHLGKVSFLRALAGGIAQGTQLGGGNIGGLLAPGGGGAASPLGEGDIALAVKSDHLAAGQVLTPGGALPAPDWARGHPPVLGRIIVPQNDRDDVRLSAALARLQETDPALSVETAEEGGEAIIRVQGPMHLRRVLAHLAEDFGIPVTERPVGGNWRETVTGRAEVRHRHKKQTGGAGQFAEVAITLAPRPRGEGFAFDETVKGGAVPRNYIPAVEAGAEDALVRGPLGFRVIDVAVTLTDGKHHAVDSSDHAFRTAGRAAVREALEAAHPVLLQGIERVEVHVPSVFTGQLIPLFGTLKGQVLGFEADPAQRGWDVFRALLPAASLDDLVTALAGATQGTAWFTTSFDHYEEVYGREAEAVSKARLAAVG